MVSKRNKIIFFAVCAVAIIVISIVILFFMTTRLVDYWPPSDKLKVERTSANTLTFTMPPIWGYKSASVAFTNCAFALQVDNVTIGPTDHRLGSNGYGLGLEVRIFKGASISNASVVTANNVSYIVYIIDSDADGLMSEHDKVIVQATEPISVDNWYSITVITEVDSFWSYGMLKGEYG